MMLRHPVLLSLLLLLLGVLTVQVASGGVGLPRRVRSIDDATACTSIGVARKASTGEFLLAPVCLLLSLCDAASRTVSLLHVYVCLCHGFS